MQSFPAVASVLGWLAILASREDTLSSIALNLFTIVVSIRSRVWRTESEKSVWFPSIMLKESLMSDNLLSRLAWSDLSSLSCTSLSLVKICRNSEALKLWLPFLRYKNKKLAAKRSDITLHLGRSALVNIRRKRCMTFADCRLQTADYRLQTADYCRLQTADHRLQIVN